MTGGAVEVRPLLRSERARRSLALAGLVVLVLAVVPPLSSWARHSQVLESFQLSVLALVVPCLLVLGAPWRSLGLTGPPGSRAFDRLAQSRRRHPQFLRSLVFLVVDLAVIVAWQTPGAVDGLVRHGWLAVPEAVSLVVAGMGLWLECVESPPVAPRLPHPQRALVAALAMWTMWTIAYLVGLSHASWYGAFTHTAGHGLSAAADQQFSTAVLWAVAAAAFLPVIFWNVLAWLRSDEDPDDELYRLIKDERRRGWGSPGPPGGAGAPGTGHRPPLG